MKLFAQVVGIVAVVTFLLSYQFKKRKNIIIVNALANFLYVLQYILLGAFEGVAMDAITAVSTVVANNKDKGIIQKYTKIIIILQNLALLGAGLALYKNLFSLCSVAGAILQASAFWLTKEKTIRIVSFLGAPFWLVYNIANGAFGSAVGSALSIASIGVAILRYDVIPVIKKEKGINI